MNHKMKTITCTLEDINAFVDTEERWTVDAEGSPVDHVEDTDYMSDPTAYICNGCETQFDAFEEVEKHLKGAK